MVFNDIMKHRIAIEARRTLLGIKPVRIKAHFNPYGISEEEWIGAYDEISIFLKISEDEFRRILFNHRKLYDERNARREKPAVPPNFINCKDRIFPLPMDRYNINCPKSSIK
jgi:hypothetical protein